MDSSDEVPETVTHLNRTADLLDKAADHDDGTATTQQKR
jgi:hypothetical protein